MIGFLEGLRELALALISYRQRDFLQGEIAFFQQLRGFFHTVRFGVCGQRSAEGLTENRLDRGRVYTELPGKHVNRDVLVQVCD